jgi:hypothetical protein
MQGRRLRTPQRSAWQVRARLLAGACVLAVLSLVASADASRAPSYAHDIPIPPDTQIGTGSLAVKCSLEEGGVPLTPSTVEVWVSGALPTIVRPGQSLWVTSIRGRTVLPAQTTDELYALGVRKLKVKLLSSKTFLRDGANSSADLVDSNNIQIPTIELHQGQPIVVTLGLKHALQLGPLATQGPGVAHLAVGSSASQATAETESGLPLFTLNTECPQPNPPQLTATVRVAGKPATGQVRVGSNYPARWVPANSLVGSTGFAYRCRIAGMGTFSYSGSGTQFGSFGPGGLVFKSGRKLPFLDTKGDATLSPKTAARLIRLIDSKPGGSRATRIRFTLLHTHETAVHLLPAHATLNAHPVVGTTEPLRLGHGLHFSFPRKGVMAPFILTAGSPGIADVWLGDEAFTLQPLTATGHPVGKPLHAACPTPHPLVPIFPAVIQ